MTAAVEMSEGAEDFVDQAAYWAEKLEAKLDLVSVVAMPIAADPFTAGGAATTRAMEAVNVQRETTQRLQALLERVPEAKRGVATALAGPVGSALVTQSAATDVLVVGSHQRTGLGRLLLGSVAEHVIRRSHSEVLVLPPGARGTGTEVLVPIDPYHFQSGSIDWVRTYLPNMDASAIYALPWIEVFGPVPMASGAIYARAKNAVDQALASRGHGEIGSYVVVGENVNAGDAIAQHADRYGAALIVMNTHGRQGLERLVIGSVAERVVRSAQTPVLIVRSTD